MSDPALVDPDCGDPAKLCGPCENCIQGDICRCTFEKTPIPIEEAKGVKGKGMPEQPEGTEGSTADTVPSRPESAERPPKEAEKEPTAPGEAPAETPPDGKTTTSGLPEATDEELIAAAKKTLKQLDREAEALDKKLDKLKDRARPLLENLRKKGKLTQGEERALLRITLEYDVHATARDFVRHLAVGTLGALSEGLKSDGEARERAFVAIRETEWRGPESVKEFVRDGTRRIQEAFRSVADPDRVLRELRRDVEEEVERRFLAANGMDSRTEIREQILREREQGEARGEGALWATAFSEAFMDALQGVSHATQIVTAFAVLGPELLGRALSGEELKARMTLGLLEGKGASAYTGSEDWTLQRGLEHVGEFASGAAAFGLLGAGFKALGLESGAAASLGRQAAEAPLSQVARNRLAGNAFRDEIAAALRAKGLQARVEVYKRTIFGPRYIDIEVWRGGRMLGGIETKYGGGRYTPVQRAKDA